MHTPARKCGPQKDLWLIVGEGSLADIDSALAQLKKNGGNINSRNVFGLTPLHIAVWRNHVPIVRRLLAAGADPDARDGESGWSSLHRALHFGHLVVASLLIKSGASIILEDPKARIPVDLLSGPVSQILGEGKNSVATEVFSWGSGVNYQLGTGNAHIQKLPCKVDSLHGSVIKLVSASKFHSVATSVRGEVYTWGFGRGGRLGHPDFDIHSGQAAVITPRQVTSGLGSRRVKAVAAAKHHSVVATEGGEVFTWGSNREGQLGYTSVDTQPTPRRVSSLRSIVAVAAANKHTAAVSDSGEVYTWGCNREGQLGYGTSNSASNYTPRVVEYLKGKVFKAVAAAKYHTIVLGADGEVYTWGHRLVTPRRVVVARSIKKLGNAPLKFQRRLQVVSVAAGMVHSWALTDDGALFYWVSSDPDLRCQQLHSMCGRNVVSVSTGKYWTAAVTSTGDVYMCDGKKGTDKPPVFTRLHGVKRATSISVGETHMLIVSSLYHPIYHPIMAKKSQKMKSTVWGELEETDEDTILDDVESNYFSSVAQNDVSSKIPSLKSLCEKVAAECLVEPRNALQMLEIADSLGADELKKYCEDIVLRNLDFIFTVSSQAFATASPDTLAELEKLLDQRSSEPWSYRRLPTPTATFPAIINSEEDDSDVEVSRTREKYLRKSIVASGNDKGHRLGLFLHPEDDPSQGIGKEVRALRKKLQQIEMLEVKLAGGLPLDDQQIAKLQTRSNIERCLAELGVPVEITQDKCSKKVEKSKKQRRKSKQRAVQVEAASPVISSTGIKTDLVKEVLDIETPQVSKIKEEDSFSEASVSSQVKIGSPLCLLKKEDSDSSNNKSSPRPVTKKKNRKGGLSMFLSGALDNVPKEAPPPPPPLKIEGPAWGGVKMVKDSTSLRAIQDEQSKTRGKLPSTGKNQVDESFDKSSGKIPLSSFLPSSPIPVVSARHPQSTDGERGTPPWAASGTPTQLTRLSLRDIQMQQGKHRQSLSHSPQSKTIGFSVASSQGSPSDGVE